MSICFKDNAPVITIYNSHRLLLHQGKSSIDRLLIQVEDSKVKHNMQVTKLLKIKVKYSKDNQFHVRKPRLVLTM